MNPSSGCHLCMVPESTLAGSVTNAGVEVTAVEANSGFCEMSATVVEDLAVGGDDSSLYLSL